MVPEPPAPDAGWAGAWIYAWIYAWVYPWICA
jgi:hypothetical protein